MRLTKPFLVLALACLAGMAAPAEAWCPCPKPAHPVRRHVAPHGKPRHVAPARRHYARTYRRAHAPRRRAPVVRKGAHIAAGPVVGTPPLYQGDLYILVEGAPLWSKPFAGAQELARLPKRTTVINMGRVSLANAAGKIVAYYYKVEAPNGKVGYVDSRKVSPTPPAW